MNPELMWLVTAFLHRKYKDYVYGKWCFFKGKDWQPWLSNILSTGPHLLNLIKYGYFNTYVMLCVSQRICLLVKVLKFQINLSFTKFTFHIYILEYFSSYLGQSWWYHQMEIFSVLQAMCAGNSSGIHLNERLSKQSWGWWFEMPSCPFWCHSNGKDRT